MKIFIVSQYFYPEEFKINDLVESLVQQGYEVSVLTGKPNYPNGKIYSGYKFLGIQHDDYKGAQIIRVPLYPRKNGSDINLILNYISFVLFSGWYIATSKIKANAILCFGTSPITQMYPALWLKKRLKCKAALWIQDLWPESVSAVGKINNSFIIRLLNMMVKNIYKRTDILFVQSKGFTDSICSKGDFYKKIVFAPNWAEDLFCNQDCINIEKYNSIIPKGFVVMFAGNIGAAQDFSSIIKAASITKKQKDIHWVIVGDGRKRKEAEKLSNDERLNDTVHFLGRFPMIEMPSFFIHADAMLVTLKDEYIFSLTIPSKTQTYMAFAKPILSMVNGVGNDIIEEAKCGLTAKAEDPKSLANNVMHLYNMNKEELRIMGNNGKKYYDNNFKKDIIINKILKALKQNQHL